MTLNITTSTKVRTCISLNKANSAPQRPPPRRPWVYPRVQGAVPAALTSTTIGVRGSTFRLTEPVLGRASQSQAPGVGESLSGASSLLAESGCSWPSPGSWLQWARARHWSSTARKAAPIAGARRSPDLWTLGGPVCPRGGPPLPPPAPQGGRVFRVSSCPASLGTSPLLCRPPSPPPLLIYLLLTLPPSVSLP